VGSRNKSDERKANTIIATATPSMLINIANEFTNLELGKADTDAQKVLNSLKH
jgi:hypothetical protein